MWRDSAHPFRAWRTLIADERGGVAVYAAIAMPLLLGSVGLGVDVGLAYSSRQAAQHQADAAAMAAALELARGKTEEEVKSAAQDDAEDNGWLEARGDTIAVESPPTAGTFAGDATAAEVQITRPVQLSFVRFVGADSDITVTARAVARPVRTDACVWSLEEIDTGVGLTGTADVELNCGVYARSTSGSAIEQKGSSCLTATSVVTAGGTIGSCINPTPRTNAAQLDDPLGALPEPVASTTCDYNNKKINKDSTISPGVYCGGIQITGNAKVQFEPGLYTLRGGEFSAGGSSELTGDEVTFFLTNDGADFATLNLTSTVLDFSPPTSGLYKGILYYQDRDAPNTVTNILAGNGVVNFSGIVYMPSGQLDFRGGSSSASLDMFLVARKLRFVGNSYISTGGASIQPSGLTSVSLVE